MIQSAQDIAQDQKAASLARINDLLGSEPMQSPRFFHADSFEQTARCGACSLGFRNQPVKPQILLSISEDALRSLGRETRAP